MGRDSENPFIKVSPSSLASSRAREGAATAAASSPNHSACMTPAREVAVKKNGSLNRRVSALTFAELLAAIPGLSPHITFEARE